MGTRGALIFRIDGQDKVIYNHFDSYPSGLGKSVVVYLQTRTDTEEIEELRREVRNLKVLKGKPTKKHLERAEAMGVFDPHVGGETLEYYNLARGCQGDIEKILRLGFYEDCSSFLQDSLFCEYAYALYLDANVLEIYKGFQAAPHTKGRYGNLIQQDSEYYPVALVKTFPLDALPDPEKLDDIVNESEVEELVREATPCYKDAQVQK
jgi:hypothetical protein